MKIFNFATRDRFFDVLQKFNQECENMITVRTTPSFYTMPESVARSMSSRLNSSWLMQRQQIGADSFAAMMDQGCALTELLNLPPEEQILRGEVAFPMCDFFDKPGLNYTREEFAEHLESVIRKMQAYPNYNVILTQAIPANEMVYVKEDMGVILVKSDVPSIAFVINEQRMVSAFWDYLSEIRENEERRSHTLKNLKKLHEKLSQI